uniref:Calmodulin-binding domain-containing protein n=1 Tax=Fagus sylvatica TaxID=28930 RepID=A0A2N9HKX6_FAGSY
MATTRGKEGTSVWKEKKVISPPKSRTTMTTKTRPKPSTTSSIDHHKPFPPPSSSTTTTTSTEKQVPNYLRPTLSSRPESQKQVKKSAAGPEDSAAKKAILNRRRSFDKPPSASRLHSALVSPGPKERTITVRSNTFSTKTTNSLKSPTPKTSKVVKPQPLHAKAMKKSNNTSAATKKESNSASASTKALDVEETEQDNGETLVHEVGETVNVEVDEVDGDGENLSEVPNGEDNDELGDDVVESEVNNGDDEKFKPFDIPEVSEEIKTNTLTAQIEEEGGDKLQEEKTEIQHGVEENGSNDNHAEESVEISEEVVEVKEDKGEELVVDTDKESGAENKNEGNIVVEEKEGVDEGSEGLNLNKEGQDVEGGVEEKKPEVVNTESSKRQVGHGKKESQAYNDVIEETASKLLEKRKNKVKALVGAFETVIDKETPSK